MVMAKYSLQDIFIKIIVSELTDTTLGEEFLSQLDAQTMKQLYSLSKEHVLTPIVSAALGRYNLLSDDALSLKYSDSETAALIHCEQMKYVLDQIKQQFNSNTIKFIVLKGSVIRKYYPKDYMRTSSDIDVLVHEEDLEKAIQCLRELGYIAGRKNMHDVLLTSPSNIHLELHFNILENMQPLDSALSRAWDYAICLKDCEFEFSKEFFLFHIYAHMYYHFVSGGCGVRSLLDIYVIKQKWNVGFEAIHSLLKSVNIYTFAKRIDHLVEEMFSTQSYTTESELLLSYIIDGGVYGTKMNSIALQKQKNANILNYSFSRIFLPYHKMKYGYPILQKLPILLPLYWVIRIIQTLSGDKRKRAKYEYFTAVNTSKNKMDTIETIRKYLEI